jgi:hypothetical protein
MSERKVVINISLDESAARGLEAGVGENISVPRNAYSMDDDDLIASVGLSDVGQEVLENPGEFARAIEWAIQEYPRVKAYHDT